MVHSGPGGEASAGGVILYTINMSINISKIKESSILYFKLGNIRLQSHVHQ